jgi:hypothetical protein
MMIVGEAKKWLEVSLESCWQKLKFSQIPNKLKVAHMIFD